MWVETFEKLATGSPAVLLQDVLRGSSAATESCPYRDSRLRPSSCLVSCTGRLGCSSSARRETHRDPVHK